MVAATAVAPGSLPSDLLVARVVEHLPAPAVTRADTDASLPFVHYERIQAGDTLQAMFNRLRIDDAAALAQLSGSDAGRRHCVSCARRPFGDGGSLAGRPPAQFRCRSAIPALRSFSSVATAIRAARVERIPPRPAWSRCPGTITHSLFGATDDAGLPDNVATQLATIFGTWIDFHTDLRKGDRFNVVHEAIYEEGNLVRAGASSPPSSSTTANATRWCSTRAERQGTVLQRRRHEPAAGLPCARRWSSPGQLELRSPPASDPRQLAQP